MTSRFRVHVEGRDIEISRTADDGLLLDGMETGVEVHRLDGRRLFLRIGGKGFEVTFVSRSASDRTITFLLNGRPVTARVDDERAMLLNKYVSDGGSKAHAARIIAPMPGKVVKLLVAPGDRIEAGHGVLILEAMKMENEIKSASAGIVTTVHCSAQDAVEKGTLLVELGE